MTVGRPVTKQSLDAQASNAVLAFGGALDEVEAIAGWLAGKQVTDLEAMTGPDGVPYTSDEAYLIKLVFEQLDAIRVQYHGGNVAPKGDTATLAAGLTGIDTP